MKTKLLSSLMALGLVLGACTKKEEAASNNTAPAATANADEAKNAEPAKADAPVAPVKIPEGVEEMLAQQKKDAAEFAKTLDEAKVKQFITYETEMAKHTDLIMGAAGRAAAKAAATGGDMGKELSRDERMKKIQEVSENALQQAGVTQGDVARWTTLTSDLTARELAMKGPREKVAQLEADKKAGKKASDIMLNIYKEQLAEHDKFRQEFAATHGEQVLAALDKHMPQILEIRQAQMDAVLGKK